MSGRLRYRMQIFGAGVQTTTGAVDFTIGSSQLASLPSMGGQRVDPLKGQVQSIPWNVDILDASSFFTKKLASTGGQMQLLGRLARIQASTNSTASSAYGTLQVGRLTDIALGNQNIASYRVTLQDERVIERNTQIFTRVPAANAITLIPAGVGPGGAFAPATGIVPAPGYITGRWGVVNIVSNLVGLQFIDPSERFPTSSKVQQAILGDLLSYLSPSQTHDPFASKGNFTYLRFRNTDTGADYEISQFDTGFAAAFPLPATTIAQSLVDNVPQHPFFVWLVWPTSQPSVNASVHGYLYFPNRPPDDLCPMLIGGSSGMQPFKMLQNVYSGAYSTTFPVRYSTAAMATMQSTKYHVNWWRITAPETMATWVEREIYQPNFSVPLIDGQGRVTPTALALPSSAGLDRTKALILGSSNLSKHPTFETAANQAVTRVVVRMPIYQPIRWYGILNNGNNDLPPDLIQATTIEAYPSTALGSSMLRSTGYLSILGQQLTLQLPNGGPPAYIGFSPTIARPPTYFLGGAIQRAQQIFGRFGNGPIWARNVQCLATVDATSRGRVAPGQYVVLNLGTYPNPANLARGGSRLMQVMTRQETPTGPSLELLDAGPYANPTTKPTLALAASTVSSRHAIKATVSHMPANAAYVIQLARTTSTGAAVPAANSSRWMIMSNGRSTGSFQIGNLPSHAKFYGRIQAQINQRGGARQPSIWSSAASPVVTAKITGPSSLKTTGVTNVSAIFKWKNGSSSYPIGLMLGPTTSIVLGTSRILTRLPAMTTRFDATLGSTQTKYKWGVCHVDAYGGNSTIATQTGTATTVTQTMPALVGRGIILIRGG